MKAANQAFVARFRRKAGGDQGMRRYVAALYDVLSNTIGSDKLVLRAGKLNALKMMRSPLLPERVLALQRLVFEDPRLDRLPQAGKVPDVISEIEDGLADLVAQRSVEDKIGTKGNVKMAERHQEYLKDLKLEALREDGGPETPATQKRLEELEALDKRKLAASALQLLRPGALSPFVGQESAIRSLLAKISSPYPQHVILYGPPGVGKTTVARLALEVAKRRDYTPFAEDAPFVEASGATLRWDPRETTNPLLGSVHDPIYQGSRRGFAETGIPEPKLGLVTKAHGGVLFIDELGEMDATLQSKLLKVLEDKRFVFESSYFDAADPSVPAYIKKLFRDGAPADFVLIGATTRDPEEIDAAIRSRCAEVYFEPLSEPQIREIVVGAARRLGVKLARSVPKMIASYTIEGRKAVQILADAFGHAIERAGKSKMISEADVVEVVQAGRMVQHTPARAVAGIDPVDYDLHVNVIGGGDIDGPSAGLGIFLALYSALTKTPVPQDVALTGELSIAGKVRAVGGVIEKVYAARQAGMRLVLIPKENEREIRAGTTGIEIVPVQNVDEALAALLSARKHRTKR